MADKCGRGKMVRVAMFTVIMLAMNAIYTVSAQPLPEPKVGQCPSGATPGELGRAI
jgi:hypothetical protein